MCRFRKIGISISLLLISYTSLRAQQYNFINYSVEDGLAQSQVLSIYQDYKGFIWLGTYSGLSKFDGKTFVNYSNENGLLDKQINTIIQDDQKNLWFGTLGGINKFDGTRFFSYRLKQELSNNEVLCIIQDSRGDLWMGTDGGGVCRFDGKKFNYYTIGEGLIDNYVRSVYEDAAGIIWFGTRGGACKYDGIKFGPIGSEVLQKSSISKIMGDAQGNLWFSTYGEGVYKVRQEKIITQYTMRDGLIGDWIRSMTMDRSGNLWLASKVGISKFNGKAFNNFTTQNGLAYNNANVIEQDIEGNVWIGTDGGGVLKFTGDAFVNYTQRDGLSNNIVLSFTEDHNKQLWFCTYGSGVCRYDGKQFTAYSTENGLSNNTVWASLLDNNNHLWFGTSDGISHYNGKKFTNYNTTDGLIYQTVYAIHQDRNGNLWFGTPEGASMFKDGHFTNYATREGLAGKNIRSIVEDKKGRLWFGTENGLYRFDGKSFTHYVQGLGDNTINSILQDKKEQLWLGTKNGLALFDGTGFQVIKIGDNYNSNYVNFMIFDDHENLWIGTNNGLYELDIKQYNETGKAKFRRHYTELASFKSLECNQNAAYRDHKGMLWFGTIGGAIKYDAGRKNQYSMTIPPFTHITGIRLFLQEADWGKFSDSIDRFSGLPAGLKVNHKKNHLTFDFIGISHASPEEVRYQFMLDGFDEGWSPLTRATFATYSNLPFGNYTFKLRAVNKDGEWSKKEALFGFNIHPPFWRTWWFYGLCVLFVFGSGFLVYRWRWAVAQRRKATQQLVYKSKLLTLEQQTLNASMNRHFIFNALNSIQHYINNQDKLAANKYLTSFAKLIRKNLDSSQTNLVTLTEELERLELYLSLEHMRFRDKFTYEVNVDELLRNESVKIPPMLLQPYVENSIWHGILPMETPGKITVNVRLDEQEDLVFTIEDNGIGVSKSRKNKEKYPQDHISRGIEIIEGRINLLRKMTNSNIEVKGPIDIQNEVGEVIGTRVVVILPVN